MKANSARALALGLALLFLLPGCSTTSHSVGSPAIGKRSSSAAMEKLLMQPGPVELESVNSADWSAPLAGLVNLSNPTAMEAGLNNREEPIQVYAHVLKHPQRGNFLVDTGIAQKLYDNPREAGLSWLIVKVMRIEKMTLNKSTAAILRDLPGKLSGVFFTHMHFDHIAGMPDIPNDVPLYIGRTEASDKYWLNLFVHGSANRLLDGKPQLQEWDFQRDPQDRLEGLIDVFEDGSVFAISVPGHTAGSTAYLVRTPQGPVLLTGDTSHTRWGWDHSVEPGAFTHNQERNLKSLVQLKELVKPFPGIGVRVGHQP